MRARAVTLVLALLIAAPLAGCLSEPPAGGDADDAPPDASPAAASDAPAPGDAGNATATGPAWSFTDTDGVEHSRDSAAGSPSVVFFMASWCSTCKSKTGTLRDVQAEYADRVHFFTVSFDSSDDDGSLEAWKEKYAQPWPHGVDANLAMQRTFGVRSQSSMVVLDALGEPVKKWDYPGASAADLRATLDAALAGA